MGEAYQIRDQEMPNFLKLQIMGWADEFSRKVYRDGIAKHTELQKINHTEIGENYDAFQF